MNQTFAGGGQTDDRPSINPRLREPDVRGSIPDKAPQGSKQRAVRAKLESLAKLLARHAAANDYNAATDAPDGYRKPADQERDKE